MTNETAKALLQTIPDIAALTYDDSQLKLKALENVLEIHEPTLYANYQREVERQRKHPPYEVNLAGYSALQARLAQE